MHTFVGRSKQPSLADLAASLTQRKNADATGVRHHVQTHRLLERNDSKVSQVVDSRIRFTLRLDDAAALAACDTFRGLYA